MARGPHMPLTKESFHSVLPPPSPRNTTISPKWLETTSTIRYGSEGWRVFHTCRRQRPLLAAFFLRVLPKPSIFHNHDGNSTIATKTAARRPMRHRLSGALAAWVVPVDSNSTDLKRRGAEICRWTRKGGRRPRLHPLVTEVSTKPASERYEREHREEKDERDERLLRGGRHER